jgi:hypothetical protein
MPSIEDRRKTASDVRNLSHCQPSSWEKTTKTATRLARAKNSLVNGKLIKRGWEKNRVMGKPSS